MTSDSFPAPGSAHKAGNAEAVRQYAEPANEGWSPPFVPRLQYRTFCGSLDE